MDPSETSRDAPGGTAFPPLLQRAKVAILRHFASRGVAPTRDEIAAWLRRDGSNEGVDEVLRRLAAAREVVLLESGELRMTMPFSAVPTSHRVVAGTLSWFANCAWDAFGIPAALQISAEVISEDALTGEAIELKVGSDGPAWDEGAGSPPVAHFAVPAAAWWDDIVET